MRVRALDRRISFHESVHWQPGYFCAASISEPSMSSGRVLDVVCTGVVLEVPVGDVIGPTAVEVVGRGGVGVVAVSLQAEPPAAEYVPAGQKRQKTSELAPIVGEYLPAGQEMQSAAVVAPVAVKNLPTLQSVHPILPVTILYFPAAQAEHVPPFGPVNPRLQTQLLNAVEPLTDCELLGQALQVLLAEAPTVVEYVWTPQFKQLLAEMAPVTVEYLPATQSSHAVLAKPATLHVPVKPLFVTEPSDVNVTLRKSVVDV